MIILTILYCLTGSIFYLTFTSEPTTVDAQLEFVRTGIFIFMLPIFIKYAVQLASAPWYFKLLNQSGNSETVKRLPKVSVIIPAWNEEVGILKTMHSVLDTQYQNLELIVVNDGSTDATHHLVTEFIERYESTQTASEKVTIKYLELANGGKAKAMNQGLEIAEGEFIVTVDADSVMDKQAIIKLLPHFDDAEVSAVAGNVIVGNRKTPIALLQQLEYLYGFFFKRADSIFNAVYIIGGAAAAYRKSTLDAVHGFDHEIITEDIEMSTRILSHGYKTRYAADSVVYTEGPSDWKGLCKQRLRWKFGRLLTFVKHRDIFFKRSLDNSYLTFLLLPIALYAELCLLLEVFLLSAFYGYIFLSGDYLPLALMILFMSGLITLQILFDPKAKFHRNILCLAPVAWILFYVIDCVEFQALVRSLKRLVKRQQLEWQSWTRVGLKHGPATQMHLDADTIVNFASSTTQSGPTT